MTHTKNDRAVDIAVEMLHLQMQDAIQLLHKLDNAGTFFVKMAIIDQLVKDYENDQFDTIMARLYKATPARIKECRLTMLYTLLPNLSEVDIINLKVQYKKKAQYLIYDLEHKHEDNISSIYDRYTPSTALSKTVNNINAKAIIFDQFKDGNTPRIRVFLKNIHRNTFYSFMSSYTSGRWNYVDGDVNLEVIELFMRRLLSFVVLI
jgi:hypothetical protein